MSEASDSVPRHSPMDGIAMTVLPRLALIALELNASMQNSYASEAAR